MLCLMGGDECDDPDECRAKWLFLCLLFAVAMVLLGLGIGLLLDWAQGRL
jgi:hypothetical protein